MPLALKFNILHHKPVMPLALKFNIVHHKPVMPLTLKFNILHYKPYIRMYILQNTLQSSEDTEDHTAILQNATQATFTLDQLQQQGGVTAISVLENGPQIYVIRIRGSAGRICHLENMKSYMSYLQQ
jgi:hypothetical protein